MIEGNYRLPMAVGVEGYILGGMNMAYSLDLVKRWIDEHDARVFGLRSSEKVIEELKAQWEVLSNTNKRGAVALAAQLGDKECQHSIDRALVEVFEAAWDELDEREKTLLNIMHRQGLNRTDAVAELCMELNCSETTVRRHYRRTLSKFAMLLG